MSWPNAYGLEPSVAHRFVVVNPLALMASAQFAKDEIRLRVLPVHACRDGKGRRAAQYRDDADTEDGNRYEDLGERQPGITSRPTNGRRAAHEMLTWLYTPYMADTSAIATNPTTTPTMTITAGSKKLVNRLIL